jgi:hypothetical protein
MLHVVPPPQGHSYELGQPGAIISMASVAGVISELVGGMVQTPADTIARLQAAVRAAQQEKDALEGTLLSATTQLTAANTKLSASETALASARTELEQKDAANAALTTANTEFEEKAAANAKTAELLSKELCSVHAMLKETLPDKVSNYLIQCWCMLDTVCCMSVTLLTLFPGALFTSH